MVILLIAEKNKAAKAIAEALGGVKNIKRTKNFTIYYSQKENAYVIPLRGHILEYKNSEAYKNWTQTNPRDIITDPNAINKVPKKYAGIYINALKEFAKKCDICIIGTDADVEGCNIGLFDAFPFVKNENKSIKVKQIWLNSLEKTEILEKFNNLIEPKWTWGEAGEVRARIDAIIGFSATREITNTFKPILEKLNYRLISIGRVQTSLLYLMYLREKAIEKFIPENYWNLAALLKIKDQKVKANHKSNPFKKQQESQVKEIFNNIKDEKVALTEKISKKDKRINPPTPLNTSKALILLTKQLKISADSALNTLNELYLNQIISYPRTDSDVYRKDFDHKKYISNFLNHSEYGEYAKSLILRKKLIPTKGKVDAGDHPPITPIKGLELSSNLFENNLQRKVYEIIARHYLALFEDPAVETIMEIEFKIKNEPFISKLKKLKHQRFLKIVPFLKKKYDIELFEKIEKEIPILKIDLIKMQTKPPPRYTDTTLLKLMELNGIGTKSTRPEIIKILIKRKLIFRKKNSYYISDLGNFLISELIKVWLPFLKPTFTKFVEEQLEKVKNEIIDGKTATNIIKNMFLELFDLYLKNKEILINEIKKFAENVNIKKFEKKDKKKIDTKQICPFCNQGRLLIIYNSNNKREIRCNNVKCAKNIAIPNRGFIEILKNKCRACGFNICKISTRKKGKNIEYFICPYCWAIGSEKNPKGTFCSNCNQYKIENQKCVKK
ncbi:MAG: DNA topoisomerase [Promethearchaeia archaeon]